MQSIDELHLLTLNVGLAVHDADWNWKNVSSPFTRLYYVTEGTAKIHLPTTTKDLRLNHLYLIPAFTKHSYQCDSHFSHYYLHIYEDVDSGVGFLEEWDFPTEVPATFLDLELFRRLCDINPNMALKYSDPANYDNNSNLIQNIVKNKQRTFCDRVESRGIVYQLLSRFLKNTKSKFDVNDNRIQQTLTYIRKNIYAPIEIDDLSRISCLSRDHFIRLFKKEVGSTPLQYINQKKIEKAQLILVTDDMPVKNIAYKLAFEDHSYFNRLFKKVIGISPLDYRHIHKNY